MSVLLNHAPFDNFAADTVADQVKDSALSVQQKGKPPARRDLLDIGGELGVNAVYALSAGLRQMRLGRAAAARMRASEKTLLRLVADHRLIYGVTTGYGPLAGRGIAPERKR